MKVQILVQLPLEKAHREKLDVGSVHDTIEAPAEEKANTRYSEVWVMGAKNESVKLLTGEFEKVR